MTRQYAETSYDLEDIHIHGSESTFITQDEDMLVIYNLDKFIEALLEYQRLRNDQTLS